MRIISPHILLPTQPDKMATQVDLTTIPISPDGDNGSATAAADSKAEDITVFHDKENFNVKHRLMHTWTLWFTKPASGKVTRTCIRDDAESMRQLTLH